MNQDLTYEFEAVMPEVIASGLPISACTIQELSGTVDPRSGQPNLDNWSDIADLTDLEAMFAVSSLLRPDPAGVKRLTDQFDITGIRHLFLTGYYPAITRENRAVVDGAPYEIMSLEFDSQKTQTRLGVRFWQK